MKVGIVGTGHVGLPTAAVLAHLGHQVGATDADGEKIEMLARGGMPFFEPGLEELVREGVEHGRLQFSEDPREVLEDVRVAFLCVGTPPSTSGEANLLAVERSAEVVVASARGPTVIVEKSTVPTGTGRRLKAIATRSGSDGRFSLACSPEFLREGSAVEDSLRPTRLLVGSDDPDALRVLRELFAPLIDEGIPWIQTDLQTAELAKHACNAFLALKISFANALARLSEAAGTDVQAVTEVMSLDPRIGRGYLSPGLGYGGSCFPKDLRAFERLAHRLGYDFPLLREVARMNDEAVEAAFRKIKDVVGNLEGKRVTLLGLAFKPNTDDVRFAPALSLATRLLDAGAHVVGYDPEAGKNAKAELPELEVAGDAYSALEGSHCAVLCTEWEEFRHLDPQLMRSVMAVSVVVDGRNMLDGEALARVGFSYIPTGRPVIWPDP